MTQRLQARPLPIPETPRLLRLVPMLRVPLPPGTVAPLAMVPLPGMLLLMVMVLTWGMPLRLGTMALPEVAPLSRIALLPKTASLLVVGMPPLLGNLSLPEAPLLRGLLLATASLLTRLFQPPEAQSHQAQMSMAFRMTPAGHRGQGAISKGA